MKRILVCSLLAATCGPVLTPQAAGPELPPPPPEARQRMERLEDKVRALRAEGRHDEARQLMAEAREPAARPEREERGPAQRERFRELRQERAELSAKLERLRAEGRNEDAAAVKERILQLEREMAEVAAQRPRPRPAERPGPPPEHPEAAQRLRHLQAAIENLRAAGLPEAAERLARERENLVRQWEGVGSGPAQPLREEIQRLRAELEEVRQALRKLNARVERFHGEPR